MLLSTLASFSSSDSIIQGIVAIDCSCSELATTVTIFPEQRGVSPAVGILSEYSGLLQLELLNQTRFAESKSSTLKNVYLSTLWSHN